VHACKLFVRAACSWSRLLTEENEDYIMQQHQAEAAIPSTSGLWIFGYGSLCWHPGFEFDKSLTGFVRGFSRKFWQGNTTHRGTESKVNTTVLQFVQIF
jgi:cation transport protein ChaC